MAKFQVRCYYTYVGRVFVEAENEEDAFNKGYDLCNDMSTEDLDYVGYTDGEVITMGGEITEFK